MEYSSGFEYGQAWNTWDIVGSIDHEQAKCSGEQQARLGDLLLLLYKSSWGIVD